VRTDSTECSRAAARYFEVKGRARVGDLGLTPNEWAKVNLPSLEALAKTK
jgi:hypothetical protein